MLLHPAKQRHMYNRFLLRLFVLVIVTWQRNNSQMSLYMQFVNTVFTKLGFYKFKVSWDGPYFFKVNAPQAS